MKHKSNKEYLDGALDLEPGRKIYLPYKTELERDFLYDDLMQRRRCLVDDNLPEYEQIIISKETLGIYYIVILAKRNMLPAFIKKPDGSREDFPL